MTPDEHQALIDGDNPQWIATPTNTSTDPGTIGHPALSPAEPDEASAVEEPQPAPVEVHAPEPQPAPVQPEPAPVVDSPGTLTT